MNRISSSKLAIIVNLRFILSCTIPFLATVLLASHAWAQPVSVSVSSVSLFFPDGPVQQTVHVTGDGITSELAGVNWLYVSNLVPGVMSDMIIGVYAPAAMTLTPGVYHGTVTVTASGGSAVVSVTLTVTASMQVSPAALTFTSTGSNQTKTLTIGSPYPDFELLTSAQTFSGGSWLRVSPAGQMWFLGTPIVLSVGVDYYAMPPGTYTGEIDLKPILAPADPGNYTYVQQRVPVTLIVPAVGGNVVLTGPTGTTVSSMSFAAQAGGEAPSPRQITVTSPAGAVKFNYAANAPWLLVNQSQSGQGTAPVSLSVGVNPAGLAANNYQGGITFTPAGGQVVTLPVTLTVTPAPSVSASPDSLSASCVAGGVPPLSETIRVSGNGGALGFTATASSAGNWLVVSPSSGTTPVAGTVPLTVSFTSLGGLTPNQVYTGTIVVAGTGGAAGSTTISVTLSVGAPLPTIVTATNAASYHSGTIAAGEIVTIFGTALGPAKGVALTPELMIGGRLPTTMGGVQVLVNNYPAALLYASATQISAIVPYEINAPVFLENVSLLVRYSGQSSNGILVEQASAAPGLFTADSSGSGPGAILNGDLTLNSRNNPAKPGDPVVLYLTGEGQTLPHGVSGSVTSPQPPYPQPVLPPVVTIDGQPAQVLFYAEAPGIVAGMLQINVQIPDGARSGDLPVVVTFGKASSQLTPAGAGAVTVSVQQAPASPPPA